MGILKIWDFDGHNTCTLADAAVHCPIVISDNKIIAQSGGHILGLGMLGCTIKGGNLKIWDLDGNCLFTLPNVDIHNNFIVSGNKIIFGSRDGTVTIWDWQKGSCLKLTVNRDFVTKIIVAGDNIIALSTYGNYFVLDGEVKIWHDTKASCSSTENVSSGYSITSTAGRSIACTCVIATSYARN